MEISRPSNLSRYIQPIILATIKRYCASAADTAQTNVPSGHGCQRANVLSMSRLHETKAYQPKRLPTLSVRTLVFFSFGTTEAFPLFCQSVLFYINVFFFSHVLHALLVFLFFKHSILISILHFSLAQDVLDLVKDTPGVQYLRAYKYADFLRTV